MTKGQRTAWEQLVEIAAAPRSPLEIIGSTEIDSGLLAIDVSVNCHAIPKSPGGMPLRSRERFRIKIPADFPYSRPSLFSAHERFAGFPHVYWATYLCLYQAPDTEWNPSDAMYGFISRMDLFLRQAALGELDPVGAPMHPPTTPSSGAAGLPLIIPQINTPHVEQNNWFGFAHLRRVNPRRLDIVQWSDIVSDPWPHPPLAAAVLLSKPLSHLFPDTIGQLISEFDRRGVNRNLLVSIIRCALVASAAGDPLILVVGAPMRGIQGEGSPKQHLTAWYIDSTTADRLRLSVPRPSDTEELRVLRADLENLVFQLLTDNPVHWCPVLEARPEIVVRRDIETPANWFEGKQIAIWGCGAIGAHIAESIVRAGAKRVVLYDSAGVKPGILVRQPFDDAEIGFRKVEVLKTKLERIRPDIVIESNYGDVLSLALDRSDWHDGVDVVIDATASRAVLTKLEMTRAAHPHEVPICSLVIGPRARRCMLVISGSHFSGGPFDAARSAKIMLIDRNPGSPYLEDFFPSSPGAHFQPEPGCSEPTFIGSHTDVLALSSSMLNLAASALDSMTPSEAIIQFAEQPSLLSDSCQLVTVRVPASVVSTDPESSFEVRVNRRAWTMMVRHIETSAQIYGHEVETGGIVLGEKDEILRTMWIDEFTPPPPDSKLAENEFICGISGTREVHSDRDEKYRGSIRYMGMWHTHPESAPVPSPTDIVAMRQLAGATGSSAAHSVMFIVGDPYQKLCFGTYVFARREIEDAAFSRVCAISYPSLLLERPNAVNEGNGFVDRIRRFHRSIFR